MLRTRVIIIGAGPTGLMAANQLSRFGIDFVLLDSKDGPTVQSRAITVTARSLEIYQQMGLTDAVLEEGARINSFNIYSAGKKKAEVKIGEIGIGLTDFHYLLGYEQSKNEGLLYQNLKKIGHEVLWNTEFISLEQTPGAVAATVKNQSETFNITGTYLIACDGARSQVRHQLNFKFSGGTYENKFFVADVVMNWPLEYDRLVISPGDHSFCAFFPLKGEHCYRVVGTLPKGYTDREDIAFEDLDNTIKRTFKLPLEFEKVNWFSVYKLHHRCVDRFQSGNVFLAGDAAHIHSPAGGQGMNTGLQDAYNLAWKIAFVQKGIAKESLLETYNEERLPFAQWLMKFTDRAFTLMTSTNWFIRNLRKYIGLNLAGFILSRKLLRPRLFKTVSQTWYSYTGKSLSSGFSSKQKLTFRTGDRLPFIRSDYYTSFTTPGFHLIHISDQPSQNLHPEKALPFPITLVHNRLEEWKAFGVQLELFILVRPDNYILLIADCWDAAFVKTTVSRHFNV